MNLLSLGDFKPSSESEGTIGDINSFLADLKTTKSSNQINIIKVETDKKSSGPIEIQNKIKISKSTPVQEKKDFINIGSSMFQNQKSNCEFSDSDIEFSDFMFSDDEEKKKKNDKNNKVSFDKKVTENSVETVKKSVVKIEKIEEDSNKISNEPKIQNNSVQKIENNPVKNNLDEICLEDDFNNGNDVFEISDISLSDKKENEDSKNNINLIESIINNDKNPSTNNNKTIESTTNNKAQFSDNNKKEDSLNNNKNQSTNNNNQVESINNNKNQSTNNNNLIAAPNNNKNQCKSNSNNNSNAINNSNDNLNNKKTEKIEDNISDIFKDNSQVDVKENNENNLFDSNIIKIGKQHQKKSVKRRKKNTSRNETRSPINILDDLQFSFDDKTENSSSFTQKKQSLNTLSNYSPTIEKIKNENIDKTQTNRIEKSTLPPLCPTRTGLENFEYSFNNNLDYYLSDFRSSFLSQFRNQIQKCFDYDTLTKNFLVGFTRELNDIIVNSSSYQNYVPASFSDIESDLNSEFNQISTYFSNSDKIEKEQFLLEDQFLPIEQVESIHSKISNDCHFLLTQITNESRYQNQAFHEDNIQYNLNSKLNEISELESKLIQIDTERNFISNRINYVKEKHSEIQEKVDFLNIMNDDKSNHSEFEELLTDLKDLKKKNLDFNFNNKEHKSTVKEICDFCSQISFHFNPMQNYSKEKTFLVNNSSYVNNLNMSNTSFQYTSLDSASYSQNGIVEDVRNRLIRARKAREETVADLRSFGPNYNFSISSF